MSKPVIDVSCCICEGMLSTAVKPLIRVVQERELQALRDKLRALDDTQTVIRTGEHTMPTLSDFLRPIRGVYCFHPDGPLHKKPRWKRRLRDHSTRVNRCGRKGMKR